MMTQSRPEKSAKPTQDPRVALQAGDAFRRLSQPFLKRICQESAVANVRAAQDIGSMIASATTLAMSVELYLKALRLLVGLDPVTDHDLCALFKHLPKDLKKSVEIKYEILNSLMTTGIDMLAVQISVGTFREDQMGTADTRGSILSKGNSLESVLKRNKDAFLTWRYLHEKGNPNGITTLVYEFSNLDNAAEAIRQHVLIGLSGSRKAEQVDAS